VTVTWYKFGITGADDGLIQWHCKALGSQLGALLSKLRVRAVIQGRGVRVGCEVSLQPAAAAAGAGGIGGGHVPWVGIHWG